MTVNCGAGLKGENWQVKSSQMTTIGARRFTCGMTFLLSFNGFI